MQDETASQFPVRLWRWTRYFFNSHMFGNKSDISQLTQKTERKENNLIEWLHVAQTGESLCPCQNKHKHFQCGAYAEKTHCVWLELARPHLNGGRWCGTQRENKDTALTWFEWESADAKGWLLVVSVARLKMTWGAAAGEGTQQERERERELQREGRV